jgi:hypothetical protein
MKLGWVSRQLVRGWSCGMNGFIGFSRQVLWLVTDERGRGEWRRGSAWGQGQGCR